MLRRPEPSDFAATMVPRMGEAPPELPRMKSRVIIARDRSGPLGRWGTRVPALPYEAHVVAPTGDADEPVRAAKRAP